MNRERPIGVAILSVLYWIAAAISFAVGLVVIVAGAGAADVVSELDSDAGASTFAVFLVAGLLILAIGGLQGALGLGLWRLQAWALWTTVVFAALGVAGDVLWLFALSGALVYSSLVSLAIHGGILAYLLTPGVRVAFGARVEHAGEIFDKLFDEHMAEVEVPAGRRTTIPCWRCGKLIPDEPGYHHPSEAICRACLAGASALRACQACGRHLEQAWNHCPYCLASAARGAGGNDAQRPRCANLSCGRELLSEWRHCPYCIKAGVASRG